MDIFIIKFLLYALAIFRYTVLIYEEDGLFDVFKNIRQWAGIHYETWNDVTEEDKMIIVTERKAGKGQLGKLLNCPFCISGWLTIFMTIIFIQNNPHLDLIALFGGLWGAVYILLQKYEI